MFSHMNAQVKLSDWKIFNWKRKFTQKQIILHHAYFLSFLTFSPSRTLSFLSLHPFLFLSLSWPVTNEAEVEDVRRARDAGGHQDGHLRMKRVEVTANVSSWEIYDLRQPPDPRVFGKILSASSHPHPHPHPRPFQPPAVFLMGKGGMKGGVERIFVCLVIWEWDEGRKDWGKDTGRRDGKGKEERGTGVTYIPTDTMTLLYRTEKLRQHEINMNDKKRVFYHPPLLPT